MPQPALLQLVRLRPVADALVPCLLRDALGVLALYAICQDDNNVKNAVANMFVRAGSPVGDDGRMVHAMYAAVNRQRTMRWSTYGTAWASVPAMLVFHACALRDGPLLRAIHCVLDARSLYIMHLDTASVEAWINETRDEATYAVLECLFRRKMALNVAEMTPYGKAEFVRTIASPRGIEDVYKYSQQIACQEFFRAQPSQFHNVCRDLAKALHSFRYDAKDRLRVIDRFIASSCPPQHTDDRAQLLDECIAIVMAPSAPERLPSIFDTTMQMASPYDFLFGPVPSPPGGVPPPDPL